MRHLLSLLILVPLGLLLLLFVSVLAPAVRLVGRLLTAGVIALLATLLLPLGPEGWKPFAIFVIAFLLLSRRRRPRRMPRDAAEQIIDQAPAPALPSPGPAWRELRGLADWRTRRRLDTAWDACARYMLAAEEGEDPSAQLPIKIARHVPNMVADCVRHSRTAAPDERRALVAETLETLESLAARAEERRRALAHDAQAGYRTLRRHLSTPDE